MTLYVDDLSTPFSGFFIYEPPNERPLQDFQLPFRDSSYRDVCERGGLGAFNSLFGIHHTTLWGVRSAPHFQLPFRDSLEVVCNGLATLGLSTPFSGFMKEELTVNILRALNFQLPFRDSSRFPTACQWTDFRLSTPFSGFRYKYSIELMKYLHTFNSLFGIQFDGERFVTTKYFNLSTPFSGFGDVITWIQIKLPSFQLPFRDSSPTARLFSSHLSPFNSLFGIHELTPWSFKDTPIAFNSLFGIPAVAVRGFVKVYSPLSTPFSGFLEEYLIPEGFEIAFNSLFGIPLISL